MANDFLQIIVSKPGQYEGNLIIGNPDATAILEDDAIPLHFIEAEPTLTLEGKTREPRLAVIMASVPFQLAMVGPGESLESITLNDVRAPYEFLFERDGANPLSNYVGLIPGGVSKIYVRAFEEDEELDSNS